MPRGLSRATRASSLGAAPPYTGVGAGTGSSTGSSLGSSFGSLGYLQDNPHRSSDVSATSDVAETHLGTTPEDIAPPLTMRRRTKSAGSLFVAALDSPIPGKIVGDENVSGNVDASSVSRSRMEAGGDGDGRSNLSRSIKSDSLRPLRPREKQYHGTPATPQGLVTPARRVHQSHTQDQSEFETWPSAPCSPTATATASTARTTASGAAETSAPPAELEREHGRVHNLVHAIWHHNDEALRAATVLGHTTALRLHYERQLANLALQAGTTAPPTLAGPSHSRHELPGSNRSRRASSVVGSVKDTGTSTTPARYRSNTAPALTATSNTASTKQCQDDELFTIDF